MRPRDPIPASAAELQRHIAGTYLSLRFGLAVIAFLFPVVLAGAASLWFDVPLRPSLSAYYHTGMRNLFVGVLSAIGVFLVLYKGFSRQEDIVLDAAGLLAIIVALAPTRLPPAPLTMVSRSHSIAAFLFFVCIAYVCIFRASDTLPLVGDGQRAERFDRAYRLLGLGMILSPVSAWLATVILQSRVQERVYVFVLESLGVWIFATYWLVKGIEIRQSNADLRLVHGELERDDRGNLVPVGAATVRQPP